MTYLIGFGETKKSKVIRVTEKTKKKKNFVFTRKQLRDKFRKDTDE